MFIVVEIIFSISMVFFVKKVDLQLWPLAYVRLLNKPDENEVNLREKDISLKCC